jgi:hypothetical protein
MTIHDNIAVLIDHEELLEFTKLFYKLKRPIFLWGTIGIGKSDVVQYTAQQLADELNLKFELDVRKMDTEDTFGFFDIRMANKDNTDIQGIPMPVEANGRKQTEWILPNFLPRNENSKGILFFDELNLSPPSVQSACYQLINDRRLGDYVLPKGWFIIACGNRVSDRTNVFEMSSALSNRFCHFELKIPNMEIWGRWALKHDIDSRIITYNYWKEGIHLFKFDQNSKSKAFPTPRSWFFANNLIKNIHPTSEEEYAKMTKLVASAVGEGVALEFEAYCKLNRKIDIEAILRNPQTIEEIEEVDLLYSVISGISEKYKKDNKIFDNVLMVCKYLKSEFAVLLLHFVRNANPSYWDKQTTTLKNITWNELANKYRNYLIK